MPGAGQHDYPNYGTCLGTLTINSVAMNTYGWYIVDLRDLWLGPTVRGSDRVIPGVNGVIPFMRRPTVRTVSLPMIVSGKKSAAGVDYANPYVGLETNIAYLRANVVDPTLTTNGTRSATLTMPSGATRTASIHVLSMTPGDAVKYIQKFTLDISIPTGAFA